MLSDHEEPRPKPQTVPVLPLDRLGVDELKGYISALRAEIMRVEEEIARKTDHKAAADKIFRSNA